MANQDRDNWEVYTISIATPEGESKASYADKESDRGDLTDQFETELFNLVAKYNSYGHNLGLEIVARNSEGSQIVQYG